MTELAWKLRVWAWRLGILVIVVTSIGGCAHYRQQRRDIAIIRAGCIEAAGNIPPEHLDAYEADCIARIRQVEAGR